MSNTPWTTDALARLAALPGLPPVPTAEVSLEAKRLLRRLKAGPASLGDMIDRTTDAGELRRWIDELRGAGCQVDEGEIGPAGTATYTLRAAGAGLWRQTT